MALTVEQQAELEAIEFGIAECDAAIETLEADPPDGPGSLRRMDILLFWRRHLSSLRNMRNALQVGGNRECHSIEGGEPWC